LAKLSLDQQRRDAILGIAMKTNRRIANALLQLLLFPIVCALCGGCATRAVWESGAHGAFHEPSIPSHLAIYESWNQKDFLVEYDDLGPDKDTPVRRAYYVLENADVILRARKPRFVSVELEPRGKPVPLIAFSNLSANPFTDCPMYAVTENHQRFAIYRDGNRLVGQFELPTYRSSIGLVKGLIVMPWALGLDACGLYIISKASSGESVGYTP
jgi:hypothetical protein